MSRKKESTSNKIGKRAYSMMMIFLSIYAFLTYRLVDIQVLKSDKYKQNVENQSTEKIALNSGRGIIYDRDNRPLTDIDKKQVIAVKKDKLSNDNKILDLIKRSTKMNEKEIYKVVQKQISSQTIKFETDAIEPAIKKELEDNEIIVEEKTLRYSKDGMLSHTIGYINSYDGCGKLGIEKGMDDILKKSNEKYVSVFKAGQAGNSHDLDVLKGSIKTVKSSENDIHLRLTIDQKIQKIVEKILDKEENPTAVVISDVDTGEILSICSRPNFDPNNVYKSLSGERGELENRAVKFTYPPGSVFKMVVLFAALENGVIDENYTYNCTGKTKIGNSGEVLRCHKANGHGVESLEDAFSNSCNTAFLDIAMKVGKEKILDSAKKLHLYEKVDLGLEEEGCEQVPKKISIRNLAIGQGSVEFTPLQINQMTQIVANNGTYKPLRLYDSLIDNNKSIVKTFRTTKKEDLISPYSITQIKEMMKSVSKNGTGRELNDLEGGCGVKTGTAQSSLDNKPISHGWVTGFYPEEYPKYAITVLVEGTVGNSKSAVPIFKEICKRIY